MFNTYGFHQCIRGRRLSWWHRGGPHSPPARDSSGDYDVHVDGNADLHIDGRVS